MVQTFALETGLRDSVTQLPRIADIPLSRCQADDAEFSRQQTHLLGRPLLVVNLADLPYAFLSPADIPPGDLRFTSEQISKRAKAIEAIARAALPEAKDLWDQWKWEITAAFAEPVCDFISTSGKEPFGDTNGFVSLRMQGSWWKRGAIILNLDRRWSNREIWSYQTGLDPQLLEVVPQGGGVRWLSYWHERSHLLQRTTDKSADFSQQWALEKDADDGALELAATIVGACNVDHDIVTSLSEASMAMRHVRALAGFFCITPKYWLALGFDSQARGECPPSPEKCRGVGDELRLRVYARLTGLEIPGHSDEIEAVLGQWRTESRFVVGSHLGREIDEAFGAKFNWRSIFSTRFSEVIQVLRDIMPEIEDPLTLRNAELVIQAAEYFYPNLSTFSAEKRNVNALSLGVVPSRGALLPSLTL